MLNKLFSRLPNIDQVITLKNRFLKIADRLLIYLSIFAVLVILYDLGFSQLEQTESILTTFYVLTTTVIFFLMLPRAILIFTFRARWLARFIDYSLIVLAFLILDVKLFFSGLLVEETIAYDIFRGRGVMYVLIVAVFFIELSKHSITAYTRSLNPAFAFLLSFLLMIFVGTALLLLPNSTPAGITLIDALFTSTSAVCVTGLIVLDTATDFTLMGKIIILCLIQAGGLGIMTFSSFFGFFFKGSTIKSQLFLRDYINEDRIGEIFRTLFKIIFFTFAIELLGAVFIFFSVNQALFPTFLDRVQFSVFHAVSGFCNAGFSTLTLGLADPQFKSQYDMQLVLSVLIIIGGLGFPIIFNFFRYAKDEFKRRIRFYFYREAYKHVPRLINVNTKIVVNTTLLLLAGGFILYYILEYNSTLAGLPWYGKIITAFFGSVTPRTAGFNTVDLAALTVPTILIYLLFMWIGASPGSTGGGIKTTTFAVGVLNTFSIAKGKDRLEVFRREILNESVRRAFVVMMLSFLVIGLAIFVLSITDSDKDLMSIIFECFSAYGTVGLSLGITPMLSIPGKVVIIITMFLGRVGTLTIFVAFIRKVVSLNYRYPGESIFIN